MLQGRWQRNNRPVAWLNEEFARFKQCEDLLNRHIRIFPVSKRITFAAFKKNNNESIIKKYRKRFGCFKELEYLCTDKSL